MTLRHAVTTGTAAAARTRPWASCATPIGRPRTYGWPPWAPAIPTGPTSTTGVMGNSACRLVVGKMLTRSDITKIRLADC